MTEMEYAAFQGEFLKDLKMILYLIILFAKKRIAVSSQLVLHMTAALVTVNQGRQQPHSTPVTKHLMTILNQFVTTSIPRIAEHFAIRTESPM